MPSLKDMPHYECKGLNRRTRIGFLVVSIGAAGAPTVLVDVAGVTITRSGAGTYDFILPEAPEGIFVLPVMLATTTLIGFRVSELGTQVKTLVENAGVIAAADPGNGDLLGFIIFGLLGPKE